MDNQMNFAENSGPEKEPGPALLHHRSWGHWLIVAIAIVAVIVFLITAYYSSSWPFGSFIPPLPPPEPINSAGPSTNGGGQFCGGIAAIECPTGYKCQLSGSYPDAGGKCVR